MLTELRVHNLALITRAELELGPGLTVLSGETGAGKTALLASLKLLIGERGDSGMVGAAGDETRVEALFTNMPRQDSCSPKNAPCATDRGDGDKVIVAADDLANEEHLVVRRLTAEGRSRCYLDDSLVTVGKLSETLGPTVDLYGQHDHQSLLRTAEQLRILDEYAGASVAEPLRTYQALRQTYQDALAQLHTLREFSNSSNAERAPILYDLSVALPGTKNVNLFSLSLITRRSI